MSAAVERHQNFREPLEILRLVEEELDAERFGLGAVLRLRIVRHDDRGGALIAERLQHAEPRAVAELQIEDLKAQLQREQLDRTMAEGALEAGRKDIARLLRELSSLKPGAVQEALLAARVQDAA